MAAFVLFVLAVAGTVVVADLVWEAATAGLIAVLHHTVTGYPEGWLLAAAAGLGFVVALLLVASGNSTKGRRGRHQQLRGLRHGREDQAAAPEPDQARLLEGFFGPEGPSRHLGGPARPADSGANACRVERMTTSAGSPPSRSSTPAEPLYPQMSSAPPARRSGGPSRRRSGWVTGERVEYREVVGALVAMLGCLNQQVAALEQQLAAQFGTHPDAAIVRSLPGLGTVPGARVLGELGDDLAAIRRPRAARRSPAPPRSPALRGCAPWWPHGQPVTSSWWMPAICGGSRP